MKTTLTFAALSLASLLSFGAHAASPVTNQQAQEMNLQPLNQTITVSGIDGDQTNVRQVLSQRQMPRVRVTIASLKIIATIRSTLPLNFISNTSTAIVPHLKLIDNPLCVLTP